MKPEDLFGAEAVVHAMKECGLRHAADDKRTVAVIVELVGVLIQAGRADALHELACRWKDQGKEHAADAVMLLHIQARDLYNQRRGAVSALVRLAQEGPDSDDGDPGMWN